MFLNLFRQRKQCFPHVHSKLRQEKEKDMGEIILAEQTASQKSEIKGKRHQWKGEWAQTQGGFLNGKEA